MARFALNKQAKTLLAVVFLLAAAVILAGYFRQTAGLPNSVNFVCVATGQKFSIDRTKLVEIPAKNPKTGEMTLLPCVMDNGALFVSSRYRGSLEALGEKNHYVDVETLAVRSTP
jgi:hypothetical protein